MNKQLSPIGFVSLCWGSLTALLFLLAACTAPPPTTAAPQETPVTPQVNLVIQSDQQEVTAGHPVAILMTLNPPAAVAEAEWTVIEGKGNLEVKAKEAVVFTPSEEAELMLIQVRGTTVDGVPFQNTINFKVVAATPVATEEPAQASTEEPSVSVTVEPQSLVTQDTLQDGQTVPCQNFLKGTYAETVTDPIWPVIFVGSSYHFQDDNGKEPPMNDGKWFSTVRFGDCSRPPEVDRGKHFQLLIITAGPACQTQIAEYFEYTRATGTYPGVAQIADDCNQIIDPIFVIRD